MAASAAERPRAPAEDKPRKIYLEITTDCNLDCRMCMRHSWQEAGGSMSPATWQTLVAQCKRIPSLQIINFSGFGEPAIHPRLFPWLAAVKAAGLRAEVVTNGTGLDAPAQDRLIGVLAVYRLRQLRTARFERRRLLRHQFSLLRRMPLGGRVSAMPVNVGDIVVAGFASSRCPWPREDRTGSRPEHAHLAAQRVQRGPVGISVGGRPLASPLPSGQNQFWGKRKCVSFGPFRHLRRQAEPGRLTAFFWSTRGAAPAMDPRVANLEKIAGPAFWKALHKGYVANQLSDRFQALHDPTGMSRTHDLVLRFDSAKVPGEEIAARGEAFDHQPLVYPDPEWTWDSKVCSNLSPRDPRKFPDLEQTIDRAWDLGLGVLDTWGDYGFLWYGDGPHQAYEIDRSDQRLKATDRRYASTCGVGKAAWEGFLRSGDRRLFDYASAHSRWLNDLTFAYEDSTCRLRGMHGGNPLMPWRGWAIDANDVSCRHGPDHVAGLRDDGRSDLPGQSHGVYARTSGRLG